MIDIRYVLIVRDVRDKQLAVIGTGHLPKTLHDKIQPKFHTFCLSVFRLYPTGATIETVAWKHGMNLDQAPLVLTAKRAEQAGSLSYSFPTPEVKA